MSSDKNTIKQKYNNDQITRMKQNAARCALQYITRDNMVIGIGSGSTIVFFVNYLIELMQEKQYSCITCIPTSFQAEKLILDGVKHGLRLGSLLNYTNNIDYAFDGADCIDRYGYLIKGGGGCHLREKMVAANAKELIIMVDKRKLVQYWNNDFPYIPIEVLPCNYLYVQRHPHIIADHIPKLRMAKNKAGPVVTDEGNFILDLYFKDIKEYEEYEPSSFNKKLLNIEGVIETGLFCYVNKLKVCVGYDNDDDDSKVITF